LEENREENVWSEAKTANLQEANRIKAVFFQYTTNPGVKNERKI
jgi:hypothetical protein